jgi:DNA invertase Pin-like site-specific DNA recombinase
MIKHEFDPHQPYRFVRYGRMSSDLQNPRSPDQQFQVIDDTIAKLGYPWGNLRDYRDDGVTGKYLRRRTGFSAMLADIRSGAVKPDLILLDTSERLGRAEELAEIRRQLRVRHGVLILTADSRFADPTTPAGHVMEAFENLRAVEENRVKGHQVRRGKVDAIRQNHWPGGPVPFGYKLHSVLVERNGRQEVDYCLLVPDPDTRWIIVKLFNRAAETGEGQGKLAEFLNADKEIPCTLRKFSPSTVGRWLANPIYIGTIVWGANAADIVEDVRILRPAAEEDVVVKGSFCEPLVSRKTWDAVQNLRTIRSERSRLAKEKALSEKAQPYSKLIKPLVPGVALVYPLSGLVVCANCSRAMTVSSGGLFKMKSGEERRYPAYFCPGSQGGACSNKRRIQEPWLFEEVVSRLNTRLFPFNPAEEDGTDAKQLEDSPWFQELLEFIQKQLDEHRSTECRNRPNLDRELEQVRDRMVGLRESLASSKLATNVRQCLEADLGVLLDREADLRSQVLAEQQRPGSARELVDPEEVLARLKQLDEGLRTGNPSEVNVLLSHFIDRIACSGEGEVTLRTFRLGLARSALASLSPPESGVSAVLAARSESSDATVRGTPRRRSIRRVEDRDAAHFVANPDRFQDLPEAWFWTETFRQPERTSWAEAHAEDVYAARFAADGTVNMTFEKLEERFEVTKPTLRQAIAIAKNRHSHEGHNADGDAA